MFNDTVNSLWIKEKPNIYDQQRAIIKKRLAKYSQSQVMTKETETINAKTCRLGYIF